MKKIILIGAGGHAKSCIDVIHQTGKFKIIGFIGEKKEVNNKICGYKVLGIESDVPAFLKKGVKHALITLGSYKDPKKRSILFNYFKKKKFIFPKIISPRAYISDLSKIGEGTIVMHDAIVNSNTKIGSNCIINTKSLIEHDCFTENNVHVSTGTIINGSVKIGSNSFIGSGTVVKNNLIIKPGTFIKMGSVLKK